MGGLSLQKRLVSKMLKVGESRVWMDPEHREEIKGAIRRADIRKMINHGYIKEKNAKIKRYTHRERKVGQGSRKGSKGARTIGKEKWMNTVRLLRKMIKDLRVNEKIDKKTYGKLYLQVKSGAFRSRSHLKLYLKQRGIISEDGT